MRKRSLHPFSFGNVEYRYSNDRSVFDMDEKKKNFALYIQ